MFTCFAHNIFSFDSCFLVKSTHLSVWKPNELLIEVQNLTNLNYASLEFEQSL